MIYSETDLVIPALAFLAVNEATGLTTSQLIKILTSELNVSGDDLRILSGRNDTAFSQKVRNLVSHRTLVNKGLATYDGINKNGLHKITPLGKQYLMNNANNFDFIINNAFTEKQRKNVIDNDFSNLIIEEGYVQLTQTKTRKRSKKLVKIAKEYYAVGGKIYCSVCNFNFQDFYGDIGDGFIEIHHLRPISIKGDTEKLLREALDDVKPVCSNCHKIIHRNSQSILTISQIKELVKDNGMFNVLG